jgi:DNA polymerase III psi subunit
MSLDNIQLSPFLVQQLYKKNLFDMRGVQPERSTEPTTTISHLGKNEKNVLVVVDAPGTAFLPDADLNLLVKILTACNLSLADVALVNYHTNTGINYESLMEKFEPVSIFLFGVLPADLQFPLHFPYFQLQLYNNQTYISAPALNQLAINNEQKKELWACLKKYISNN